MWGNTWWNCRPKAFQCHLEITRNKVNFRVGVNHMVKKLLTLQWDYYKSAQIVRRACHSNCQHHYPYTSMCSSMLTFIPISILERSAKGTSRVTSSHRSTAKLHMSAERLLVSSGFFCRAGRKRAYYSSCLACPISASSTVIVLVLLNSQHDAFTYLQGPPRQVHTCALGTGKKT